jgi:hypothetical protein
MVKGWQSLAVVSKVLEISSQTLHNWVKAERKPNRRLTSLLTLSKWRVCGVGAALIEEPALGCAPELKVLTASGFRPRR